MAATTTPETDQAEKFVYGRVDQKWVEPSFARKLERQKNALLSALERLYTRFQDEHSCRTGEDLDFAEATIAAVKGAE